jgi:argininosuccinate lyase
MPWKRRQHRVFLTPDLADYLVGKGMPFREAHGCVGQAVRLALQQNKELHEFSLEELQSFSALIQEDIFESLSLKQLVDRRTSFGGTASKRVTAAIKKAEQQLGKISKCLGISKTK